jgi:hypothetical protein
LAFCAFFVRRFTGRQETEGQWPTMWQVEQQD